MCLRQEVRVEVRPAAGHKKHLPPVPRVVATAGQEEARLPRHPRQQSKLHQHVGQACRSRGPPSILFLSLLKQHFPIVPHNSTTPTEQRLLTVLTFTV